MNIINDTTYRPHTAVPTFMAIKYHGAENTLRENLTSDELEKFKRLVARNNQYVNADLVLYGDGYNLSGKIVDNVQLRNHRTVEVRPISGENKLRWIFRMAKKMRDRDVEVTELLKKQNFQF
ncbi:hypothetical protein J6P92_09615 [bacterium]|nr:hypothetical protein [bacterium]